MEAKDTVFKLKKTLNIKGKIMDLTTPVVMSIINVTPDSFYPGSRAGDSSLILKAAEKALSEGATFLDVGGYSTRPGADVVSPDEELSRVLHGIELILKEFPEANISIDTFRAAIARRAVEVGACLINDISGGELDEEMFETVAKLNVPYVLMHMKGDPQHMKNLTSYQNLLLEIVDYFQLKMNKLRKLGVIDIVTDPGFGFAKSIDQNYEILKNLKYFAILSNPILVGISRKSMIYKRLQIEVEKALNGSTVLNTIALCNKASILRVHDTKEAVETIKLLKYINS